MAELKFVNVVKRYGKTPVIHGLDLAVRDKEFLVLVGPSGCGKSTLLRMVAGLEKISQGQILINDKVVNDLAPKDRGLAMVFQNYALYPHMNVFDNMSFGLRLSKTPANEIRERVEETAAILGLEELLLRKPNELSGGQRQRVAMGRAMVRKPSIFLFDEPLSNLDAKLRIQMRAEIKLLHQRVNATILYVTHDQIEAMTLADRIVVLKDGHIEQVGTPLELFSRPANTFVAGFIGTPPMNLIPGILHGKGQNWQLEFDGGLRIPVPHRQGFAGRDGDDVIFGLRAESASPVEGPARGEWCFEGRISVVEPLGHETHLHMDINGVNLLARSTGRDDFHPGDRTSLALDLREMHLFDANTARAIY
ncbi:MAG: sn-glycerol-3-phosphate ABC transporter ATP-binding protein UgpC [Desulfobacterales bacterium]|nr:sn-glycerol-3-phosphate ABC transporter ATP-binding protein UgpC [Desulfobacterales bacterium]